MPTRNISLTPEQDTFVEEKSAGGEYADADEAMRDAVRALRQRRAIDALTHERLRRSIDAGLAHSSAAHMRKSRTASSMPGSVASPTRARDPSWRPTRSERSDIGSILRTSEQRHGRDARIRYAAPRTARPRHWRARCRSG